jgi:hypothetical protein
MRSTMAAHTTPNRRGTTIMQYFQITGKAEEWTDSSYTVESTGEVVEKRQLSLVIPGMRDRILCEFPRAVAPKDDLLDKWELEEQWIVVSAEGMRALAFKRSNARAGEKDTAALVVFQGIEAREATPDERRALQQARKLQKAQAKQRRAERQAEKKAAKQAQQAQQAQQSA